GGEAPITPDFMLRLGHAVGQVLCKGERRPTVLIGKDTRISGYMIEAALEAGFASAGVDVVLTGPLPTPGVAYLTRALRLDLGVVISASHNAFADYGITLDGDGDRLQVVDGAGRLYNGDELLYVLAAARLDHGRSVAGVVGTLMTNLGVEQALRRRGVDVVRTAVGDRYVLEELLQRGWQLGGEGSGHLLALDRHTTGAGLVSALMVLEAVVRSRRRLSDLLAGVDLFPQTLINVRLKPGADWKTNRALA